METTIVYWGYIGIMEKKMETRESIGAGLGPRSFLQSIWIVQ